LIVFVRTLLLIFTSLFLVGCQYDPHAHLYTTSEPANENIVGTYVLEDFHLPQVAGEARPQVVVELHADGTFAATNVPPWTLEGPGTNFFATLVTGTGKWEKSTLGMLDPGQKKIWGVYLRTPDNAFHSAFFTGDRAPYGLIFTLGDPDSGDAVLLKRKQ
jgi:hypothetical protein